MTARLSTIRLIIWRTMLRGIGNEPQQGVVKSEAHRLSRAATVLSRQKKVAFRAQVRELSLPHLQAVAYLAVNSWISVLQQPHEAIKG